MSDLPIACDLSPDDLAVRRASLLAELRSRCADMVEIESGVRLALDGSAQSVALAVRAIEAERQCCRFLSFRLTFGQNLGPVELEITGPPGTREFLASILADGG